MSELPAPGTLITDTGSLDRACSHLCVAPFLAVDTEFHRESTYWPRLCLIQVATPATDIVIDPLAEGLDLSVFLRLLSDPDLTKVMHGARQDMEIFWHLTGSVPVSVFDTQIASMACDLGDMVSYDSMIRQILGEKIDKAQQMTDWARRPMKPAQLRYARADVTFLARAYPIIRKRLEERGRMDWIADQMAALGDPAMYENSPDDALQRIRGRRTDAGYLTILAAVAGWREQCARDENRPRQWILRDDAVHALAAGKPQTHEDLRNIRILGKKFAESRRAAALLEVVRKAQQGPQMEGISPVRRQPTRSAGLTELLRCLLRTVASDLGVAPRLIADAAEIKRIACGERQTPCMSGWRFEVFGSLAMRLCAGELFLGVRPDGSVTTIESVSTSGEEFSRPGNRPD